MTWSNSQTFCQSKLRCWAQHKTQPSSKKHSMQNPQNENRSLQSCYSEEVQSTSLPAASCPLNPLSKVLFILPSWYLFTIGLKHVILLGQRVPPNWRSTPEEHDSQWADRLRGMTDARRDLDPHWCSFPRDLHLHPSWQSPYSLQVRVI